MHNLRLRQIQETDFDAMSAFLEEQLSLHATDVISAGAFVDNPASQRVLEKLGFERVGESMHKVLGRSESAPLILFEKRNAKICYEQDKK